MNGFTTNNGKEAIITNAEKERDPKQSHTTEGSQTIEPTTLPQDRVKETES